MGGGMEESRQGQPWIRSYQKPNHPNSPSLLISCFKAMASPPPPLPSPKIAVFKKLGKALHLSLLDFQPLSSILIHMEKLLELLPIEVVESIERMEGINVFLSAGRRISRHHGKPPVDLSTPVQRIHQTQNAQTTYNTAIQVTYRSSTVLTNLFRTHNLRTSSHATSNGNKTIPPL